LAREGELREAAPNSFRRVNADVRVGGSYCARPMSSTPSTHEPGQPLGRQRLTAEDLAQRWQVSESHVYHLTRRGVVPVVRLGRYYRYRVDAIEAWERSGGVVNSATVR